MIYTKNLKDPEVKEKTLSYSIKGNDAVLTLNLNYDASMYENEIAVKAYLSLKNKENNETKTVYSKQMIQIVKEVK